MKACKKCGKRNPTQDEWCPYCGYASRKKSPSFAKIGYRCLMAIIVVAVIALITKLRGE